MPLGSEAGAHVRDTSDVQPRTTAPIGLIGIGGFGGDESVVGVGVLVGGSGV